MPEHIFPKDELIQRFDSILGSTLEEIDDRGLFLHMQDLHLQKGIVGTLIEQCVLGYEPDARQEADLIVVDGDNQIRTELKSTGIVIVHEPNDHFVAKEPMSITAVGIYDIVDQEFWTSHFWDKLGHMLLVFYHYTADHPVPPYDYRSFPIKGYKFHEFSSDEIEGLKQDWENVKALVERIISHHPGPHNRAWKDAVKQEYIDTHGELRRVLSYIDLAPRFPPRFRLKKSIISSLIGQHFGYQMEQLPGRYTAISDIDAKCRELTRLYSGKTIGELARQFGIPLMTEKGRDKKGIAERIVIAMFGGISNKLNKIELFSRFNLIAKTIAVTPAGGRTEDMKLFQIDFEEWTRTDAVGEDGDHYPIVFEDSELYSYFINNELLCIMFEEPECTRTSRTGQTIFGSNALSANRFIGFKRLVFSDAFIDGPVRSLWEDTRDKIMNGTLIDVIQKDKDGTPLTIGSGEISSAPNFMKSSENTVFIRGSGINSSLRYKTECVNNIRMLPQYVWLKGTAVVRELRETPAI